MAFVGGTCNYWGAGQDPQYRASIVFCLLAAHLYLWGLCWWALMCAGCFATTKGRPFMLLFSPILGSQPKEVLNVLLRLLCYPELYFSLCKSTEKVRGRAQKSGGQRLKHPHSHSARLEVYSLLMEVVPCCSDMQPCLGKWDILQQIASFFDCWLYACHQADSRFIDACSVN